MMRTIILLTIAVFLPSCLFTQGAKRAENPRPAVDLTAGSWKYKTTAIQADGKYESNDFTTIKVEKGVWLITDEIDTPDGRVTDISTLDKGTLILRTESFKHFGKPGRPGAIVLTLNFSDSKVSGSSNIGGKEKPVAIELSGPVGSEVAIGCLPLSVGYKTSFRDFDVQELKETLRMLTVVAMERVTVPAGTFDTFKVELSEASGGADKKIFWIAKGSCMAVKISENVGNRGGTTYTTELVP